MKKMKTSNKILTVYGALFAVFTFGSLALNVHEYRASQGAIQQFLETLSDGKNKPVLVVDAGMTVSFHRNDYGSMMFSGSGSGVPEARISGDTLFVKGGANLAAPNSVKRIIRDGQIIDVPPVEEWSGGEIGF